MSEKELCSPILLRLKTRSKRCSPRDLIEDIRANILRLLNARLAMPSQYVFRSISEEEAIFVSDSTVNFGITDINSLNLGDETMEKRFRDSIRLAVRRFEPRIANAEVEIVATKDQLLTIRLTGQLKVPPYSPIEFESGLTTSSTSFRA